MTQVKIDLAVARRLFDGWHAAWHEVDGRKVHQWRRMLLHGGWQHEDMTQDEHAGYVAFRAAINAGPVRA